MNTTHPFLTLDLDEHEQKVTFYRATLDPERFPEGNLLNNHFESFGSTPEEATFWLKQALKKHAEESLKFGFDASLLPFFYSQIEVSPISLGDCFKTDKEQE